MNALLARVFVDQWSVFLVSATLLLALAEAGYRLGRAARRRSPDAAEGHSGNVQGAVLGLLGLMLGFSFAMAVGRYDTRRELVVDEANSIGTTWLRAELLEEARCTEVRSLLRRYVEAHLEAYASADDRATLLRLVAETEQIQQSLWRHATEAAAVKPDAVTVSFVTSLNETIDLQAKRIAASRNHVPTTVWLLLLLVASCGAWASGYGGGTSGQRSTFSQIVFPVLIGVVITLVSDIDQPRKGLISVSQVPLQELLESMQPRQP